MGFKRLNYKQEAFVREFLVDGCGAAAYRRAGYKASTNQVAAVGANLMLERPYIKEAIDKARQERNLRIEMNADRVLREIRDIAFLDPIELFEQATGCLLPLDRMPEHARRAIASLEVEELYTRKKGELPILKGYLKKIKLVSKEGTLSLAGRHLGMFVDKTQVSGPDDGPIEVTEVRNVIKAKLLKLK